MAIDSVFIPAPPRRSVEDEIAEWEEGYKRLNLHDAHVRASGHRNRRQLLDMTFYHQIYSVPLVSPRDSISPLWSYLDDRKLYHASVQDSHVRLWKNWLIDRLFVMTGS